MQEAVDGKVSHLALGGVAEFFGLGNRAVQVDDDVPQRFFLFGDVIVPFVQSKGEHVRRRVYISIVPIQFMNRIGVADEDADFRILRHLLQLSAFLQDGINQFLEIFIKKFHVTIGNGDFHVGILQLIGIRDKGQGIKRIYKSEE